MKIKYYDIDRVDKTIMQVQNGSQNKMYKLRTVSLIFLIASCAVISCGGQDTEPPDKVSESEPQQEEQKSDSLFFVNLDASEIENLKKD